MLTLPAVQVTLIDTAAPALARASILDTLAVVKPARCVVWSDTALKFPARHGVDFRFCPKFDNGREADAWFESHGNRVLCHEAPAGVTHFLLQQWDGWVVRPEAWTDEFLSVDYIGAPWWFTDGLNVGNGGFCLVSLRLSDYLHTHRDEFPRTGAGDETLCRRHRPELERRGFRWASEELANRFAFEHRQIGEPFGFHAIFNWPTVLDRDRFLERLGLCNDYVLAHPHWQMMVDTANRRVHPIVRPFLSSPPPPPLLRR